MEREYWFEGKSDDQFLLNTLNQKRKKGIGVDCTIVARRRADTSVFRKRVHGIIVSSASKHCEQIIKDSNYLEAQAIPEIVIPHTTSELALEEFIEYLYTNRCHFSSSTACELVLLSHTFEISPALQEFIFECLYSDLKTENDCKSLIELARQFEQNNYIGKGMESWINIHALGAGKSEQLWASAVDLLKKYGTPEQLWASAVDLLKKYELFQSVWSIVDVVIWIGHLHMEFNYLLTNILPNQLVQRNNEALKYVAHAICTRAESNVRNITFSNCFLLRNLQKAHFQQNEFQSLQQSLLKCIAENFSYTSKTQRFLEIDPEELTCILKSPYLQSCRHEHKFQSLVKWIKHRRDDVELFPEIFTAATDTLLDSEVPTKLKYVLFLQAIELEKFSCDFLLNSILKSSLTQNCEDAKKLTSKSICSKIDSDAREITIENCFIVRKLQKAYQFTEYINFNRNICLFIITNLEILAERDEFVELEHDEMLEIFASPAVPLSFEKEKFPLILTWVNYQEGREEWLPALFSTIKLSCLSNESIQKMTSHPLIKSNNSLLYQVIQALCNGRNRRFHRPCENVSTQTDDDGIYLLDAVAAQAQPRDSKDILESNSPISLSVPALEHIPVNQYELPESQNEHETESIASDTPSHKTDSTAYSFATVSYASGRSSPVGYDSEIVELHGSEGLSGNHAW